MSTKRLNPPRSLGRLLNFTTGAVNNMSARVLEPHGLSLAQWVVLSALWRNGDLSVKELSGYTGNAPPATSRIVDRMIAAGLLVRVTDTKDRRAVVIGLTQKGRNLRHLENFYEDINAMFLEGFSEDEKNTLFSLLERIEETGQKHVSQKT
ncbi:DNA-binding transcriptional regulator, MarR family [Cohaesibacter sp. ES.047]|uniref:MarR family winged helix-turn-helix transcriptional regulator n=1 Tax=Cohaesibacter sp. ES.047 TaxID=1798205 RepID=UPI000BC068EA|nr:MarR family winged helix-turn-helix transcriptional regulator [Cohaesibacter sp. ES.047]SNY92530.1 DNA-binding transcriptional regulator, MarR family [Cohaesibacter sp. ES.047]